MKNDLKAFLFALVMALMIVFLFASCEKDEPSKQIPKDAYGEFWVIFTRNVSGSVDNYQTTWKITKVDDKVVSVENNSPVLAPAFNLIIEGDMVVVVPHFASNGFNRNYEGEGTLKKGVYEISMREKVGTVTNYIEITAFKL